MRSRTATGRNDRTPVAPGDSTEQTTPCSRRRSCRAASTQTRCCSKHTLKEGRAQRGMPYSVTKEDVWCTKAFRC